MWKNITEKKYSVYAYGLLQWFLNFLIFAVFFLLNPVLPYEPLAYLYMGLVVVVVMVANLALLKAYKTEDISNVNTISKISLVITFLSGVIFLSESINIFKAAGVLLVMLGVIVIFYEGKKIKLKEGSFFALLGGILYGLIVFFYKKTLFYFSPISFLFLFNLLAVLVVVWMPKAVSDGKVIFAKHTKAILLSRIFMTAASLIYLFAIQRGNISVVNTNNDAFDILTAVFIGIVLLKEKRDISKKIIGAIFCIGGIALLNFF
ncbi:MAG: hypothetical protein UT63_C0009G0005 [Candidatus Gottesmanbacteria bacterium GW2011_GWC2_39_8]|uniref:EamA domain-containing protein n=1 Tax=Candidatus Gottesmanbacteria bacterium GW2011_GWC2_39_8 TaxID=1618450 RepID=A0A0G0SGZ3_9BACT|nr:MAG: hypothetical protein UT63_C0009G0005 [Candidatus Gottesmanbacteria bacterium GW2011_GWC2_39_8]